MILIWDSPELNHDDCEYKILWQSYTVVDPEKEVSIPQLVEGNADELRSKYLSFVYELGEIKVGNKRIIDHLEIRPEFSFWWMTLLVEKCNYAKSPQINSIIKLMALEEWLVDKNFTKIKIATKNQELANAVNQLTGKLGVLFEREKILSKKVTESLVRRVYNTLPDIFKVPVFFVYYLINRWKLKGVGVEKWKNATAKITFVSYFFNLDVDSVNEGVFKDRYWTKLPDLLDKNNIKSSWLHLYVKSDFLPTSTSAKQLIEKFNESHNNTQHHVFLDSFLSLKVVGWTVINWIMLLFKHGRIKSNIEQQANYLWPLIKSDLKVSLVGVAAIQNLLFYHLFRSAMQALPTQRKGFYLQENQGWEFGFVGSWREFVHGQLIGVPHSTVRYWDLRYFFDSKSYGKNGNFDFATT